jgi:hypothetical protein
MLDSLIGTTCKRCRQYEKLKYCLCEARYQLGSLLETPGNDFDEATTRDVKDQVNKQYIRVLDAHRNHIEEMHVR